MCLGGMCMTKQNKTVLGISLLSILTGFAIFYYNSTTNNTPKIDTSLPAVVFEEISIEQYRSKISNNETFTVYIGRPDCSTCHDFKPALDQFLETHRGGTLYYFNTKTIRDASKTDNNEDARIFYDLIREEFSFAWTPTINHYEQGVLKDSFQFLDEDYYELSSESKKRSAIKKDSKNAITFMTKYVTD